MILPIALLVAGLGLIIWAIILYRRRRKARSLAGVGALLLLPIGLGVGGVAMVGGAAVSSQRTINFTITCANGVAPTRVRFNTAIKEGQELLNCRTPENPNVYKGELTEFILVSKVHLTAIAAGQPNLYNSCNFSYKGANLYASDRALTEGAAGKYNFNDQPTLP